MTGAGPRQGRPVLPYPRRAQAAASGQGGDDAAPSDQNQRSSYIRGFREAPRGQVEGRLLADGAAELRQAYAGLDEPAIAAHVADMSTPGPLAAAVDWYRAMSAKASAAVPPCPVPILHVWGDADPAIGRASAEATADHVTGPYDFVALEGVGHWIPEEAAAIFTPLLLAHLAATPPR